MAEQAGLELMLSRNITAQTMPTYSILDRCFKDAGIKSPQADAWTSATRWLQWLSRRHLLRYRVVAFRKPLLAQPPS
jgi:hypothetical protein